MKNIIRKRWRKYAWGLVCSYLMASVPLYITGSPCEIKAEKHDQVHLESKLSQSSLVSVSRAGKHSAQYEINRHFLNRDMIWWLKLHRFEHSVKNAATIRHQNLNPTEAESVLTGIRDLSPPAQAVKTDGGAVGEAVGLDGLQGGSSI